MGLWCSDSSDNDFDDFKVYDAAGPYVADARWFSDRGPVRVDNSDNNVIETDGSLGLARTLVRRGLRYDKYCPTLRDLATSRGGVHVHQKASIPAPIAPKSTLS